MVTSVDPSPEAVEFMRARVRGPVLAAAAEALPFEDISFDGAVLGEVLEHVEDDLAGYGRSRGSSGPAASRSPSRRTRTVRPERRVGRALPPVHPHARCSTCAPMPGSTSSASARGASRSRASTTAGSTSPVSRPRDQPLRSPASRRRRPGRRTPGRPAVRRRRARRPRLPRACPLADAI